MKKFVLTALAAGFLAQLLVAQSDPSRLVPKAACAITPTGIELEVLDWQFTHPNWNPAQPNPNMFVPDTNCISLTGLLPVFANLTLTPVKDNNPLNGVSTYDMLLISKHILGNEPFDSPWKFIAADVNKSGTITSFDILEMRKLVLGVYTDLPNNNSWRFVLGSHVFPNPFNPLAAAFPESVNLGQYTAGDTIKFIAVKVGDVNGNALANNLVGDDADDRATASFSIENQSLAPDETVLVPVFASENRAWLGFQFSLGFDPAALKIEAVVPAGALPDLGTDNFAQPRPGQLNVSWHSPAATEIASREPLFYLKIKALQPVQLDESLRLASGISNLTSEVYDVAETRLPLGLVFREKTALADAPHLSHLQPNPATDAAFFTLQLPETASVRLEIFDLAGRLLRSQTADFQAGTSRVEVPVRDLPSGPLAYRVAVGGTAWSGRFVKN